MDAGGGLRKLQRGSSRHNGLYRWILPVSYTHLRRFVAGESSRSIKSDPRFIAMREYVLSRVFEQREAFS